MHLYDIIALIVYFVIVAGLGLWTASKVKTMGDFVMPRKFGKTMMLFFGFGSGTHSDQAVSVALETCLGKLSAKQREIVERRYLAKGSLQDLAEESGRSANALYKTLQRIREVLHHCINKRLTQEGFTS